MCIYTNARCKVFTIRVLIREWLKFVQIRWVMRKEALKGLLSSFWVQYLKFELWMIVSRSILIELNNRCVKSSPLIVLNTKCAFIRTRDLIREWLKFVQIRWVLRKDALKRHFSSFWLQYLHFELWIIVSRSILINLDNRCVKSPPFNVQNTKCAFIRTRDVKFSRYVILYGNDWNSIKSDEYFEKTR